MPRYESDQCGACCKGRLIVETEELDILREPRLIETDPHHRGMTVEKMLDEKLRLFLFRALWPREPP